MKLDEFMNRNELHYEETSSGIIINIQIFKEDPEMDRSEKWNVQIYSNECDRVENFVVSDIRQLADALLKYME